MTSEKKPVPVASGPMTARDWAFQARKRALSQKMTAAQARAEARRAASVAFRKVLDEAARARKAGMQEHTGPVFTPPQKPPQRPLKQRGTETPVKPAEQPPQQPAEQSSEEGAKAPQEPGQGLPTAPPGGGVVPPRTGGEGHGGA